MHFNEKTIVPSPQFPANLEQKRGKFKNVFTMGMADTFL